MTSRFQGRGGMVAQGLEQGVVDDEETQPEWRRCGNRAATEPNPRLGLAAALRSGAERLGSGRELAKEVEAESRRRASALEGAGECRGGGGAREGAALANRAMAARLDVMMRAGAE